MPLTPTLDTLDVTKWFYFSESSESDIPADIKDFYGEDIEKEEPIVALDVLKDKIERLKEEYIKNESNFFTFTFVIPQVHRKNVVRIYGFENTFYKSVLVQMYN